MTDAFYGSRRTDGVICYLKRQPKNRISIRAITVNRGKTICSLAVGTGQVASVSVVYLIFKHFEFIKHCFVS